MLRDDGWPVARLIPLPTGTGVEAKERHAASALLAVLTAVNEFGRSLLRPLGAPGGRIEAYVEVPFKLENGKTIRPDGVIGVTRAGKTWWAFVECKIADQPLTAEQMEGYLDLARSLGVDAVLSISNHYATHATDYPIPLDRKKLKKVSLHHWSWVRVLTEAEVQKQYRGVKDPDQAWILNELIRYLSDPRSGVVQFNDMGPSWTAVREGARVRTLRKADPAVAAVAARWDELVRFLSLDLTKELGLDVKQVLRRQESTASARHEALADSLARTGRLYAELHIPNTAGSLEIVADLRSRQIVVSTQLDAPKEGKSRGRVGWLLRQLKSAPDDLTVEARLSYTKRTRTGQLGALHEDHSPLIPDRSKEIKGFRVSLTRDMGLNRTAGRNSFIDSVVGTTKTYYREVLQNLTAWKPRATKLPLYPSPTGEGTAQSPPQLEKVLDQGNDQQALENP